jgi:hypothetical protein
MGVKNETLAKVIFDKVIQLKILLIHILCARREEYGSKAFS